MLMYSGRSTHGLITGVVSGKTKTDLVTGRAVCGLVGRADEKFLEGRFLVNTVVTSDL